MAKIRIGLIGFGTVGTGVYKSLQSFGNVEVVKIAVKNINKPRAIEVPQGIMTDNPFEITNNPDIDVVVELMGGVEPAWNYIENISAAVHLCHNTDDRIEKWKTYSYCKQRTSC